jgi:hypothetical protein
MKAPDETDNPNVPSSSKLPPVNREPKSTGLPKIPTAGVSPKLKIFVIGMTFITMMAFGLFVAMFVKKAFINEPDGEIWGPQLLAIGKQLEEKGLKLQAIEHYQKYLDTQKVDMKTRSDISFYIASLYTELGQCDDAVVWFLHADTAQHTKFRIQKSEEKLQTCRSQSNTSQ